jgi:hypothetical protein
MDMHRLCCPKCSHIYFTDKEWSKSCYACYKKSTGNPINFSSCSPAQRNIVCLRADIFRLEGELRRSAQKQEVRLQALMRENAHLRRQLHSDSRPTVDRRAVRALLRIVHPDRAGALSRLPAEELTSLLTDATKILNSL